jgi:outer membrane protein OmpU
MKKVLFASTALAAMAIGGVASAQGIALFGDARLGLGWNIDNDGIATGEDELRGVSRIRFGVNMTGETDSGITFGGTIRADNAVGGQGGNDGQRAGSVFVSGAWGTVTMGDTNGADEQWVGDLNEVGLTCLGCQNETPFISNGGNFGGDGTAFADNPLARPTIRYDYDFAGFGISLSSNRDLDDIGVGGGWTGEFGATSVTVGLGYYDFTEFTDIGDPELIALFDINGDPVVDENGDQVVVEGAPVSSTVPAGKQWSAAIGGEFESFNGKVIYTQFDSDDDTTEAELLGLGLGADFGPWGIDGYYFNILSADGTIEDVDGNDSLGVGVSYDLGGGATVKAGFADTFADDQVADFGISMAF